MHVRRVGVWQSASQGNDLAFGGGILLGGFVDRSKRYKEVTLVCFAAALLLLQPLGLSDVPLDLR